jgi:O-antigen/teichoic acid export membrane protein
MFKLNIIEIANKTLGFVITAFLARVLINDFGTYLYYQTIFGYLFSFALFSSDYNFLINYQINKEYLKSELYYQTVFIKLIIVVSILIFGFFSLIHKYTEFAFWPYLICVGLSLFSYDFILYVENDKKNLILFRFLSQLTSLCVVLLFYFQLANPYYITMLQLVQTAVLGLGTFYASKKYHQKKIDLQSFWLAIKRISYLKIWNAFSYFLLRNFIGFFTTIELVIFSYKGMLEERNIFSEGLRLSGLLMPFALLYINFNITKVKREYYVIILLLSMCLLFFSPIYVFIFMGETFISKTFLYNFFILVFSFNAFLEKDYLELLTHRTEDKDRLVLFNVSFFLISVAMLLLLFSISIPYTWLVLLFLLKLFLYYIGLIKKFALKISYRIISFSFLFIVGINFFLEFVGYYQMFYKLLIQLKSTILE